LFLQGTAGITAILVLAIVATGFVNLRTIRNYLRLSELDSDDRNFRLDAARHFADEKFLPAMPRLLELVHSEPKERAEGASRRSEQKERAEGASRSPIFVYRRIEPDRAHAARVRALSVRRVA